MRILKWANFGVGKVILKHNQFTQINVLVIRFEEKQEVESRRKTKTKVVKRGGWVESPSQNLAMTF